MKITLVSKTNQLHPVSGLTVLATVAILVFILPHITLLWIPMLIMCVSNMEMSDSHLPIVPYIF